MIIDYQGTIIGIDQIILRLFTIDARKAVITLKKVASLVTTIEATLFSLLKNKKNPPDVSSSCDPPPKIAKASPKF